MKYEPDITYVQATPFHQHWVLFLTLSKGNIDVSRWVINAEEKFHVWNWEWEIWRQSVCRIINYNKNSCELKYFQGNSKLDEITQRIWQCDCDSVTATVWLRQCDSVTVTVWLWQRDCDCVTATVWLRQWEAEWVFCTDRAQYGETVTDDLHSECPKGAHCWENAQFLWWVVGCRGEGSYSETGQ